METEKEVKTFLVLQYHTIFKFILIWGMFGKREKKQISRKKG